MMLVKRNLRIIWAKRSKTSGSMSIRTDEWCKIKSGSENHEKLYISLSAGWKKQVINYHCFSEKWVFRRSETSPDFVLIMINIFTIFHEKTPVLFQFFGFTRVTNFTQLFHFTDTKVIERLTHHLHK